MRPFDVFAGVLQGMGVQTNAAGMGFNGSVAVPQKAVAAVGYIIEQQGQVTIVGIVAVLLRFFGNQLVQITEGGKLCVRQGGDIRVPIDAEAVVKLDDALFQDDLLHVREAGQVEIEEDLQILNVERHVRHAVALVPIQLTALFVRLILAVPRRWPDLQRIDFAVGAASRVNPVAIQIQTQDSEQRRKSFLCFHRSPGYFS